MFISHRWGGFDDKLVSALFDRLTLHTVGTSNRSIFTFLDSLRLQLGKHFQLDFAKALVKSSVIVPFVTRNALERMTVGRHDANKEDNVLVEWMTGKKIPADKLTKLGTREEHEVFTRDIMGLSLLEG